MIFTMDDIGSILNASILHTFVLHNDMQMVKFLLDHGADQNLNLCTYRDKLWKSIKTVHMAKLLYAHGMKFNDASKRNTNI